MNSLFKFSPFYILPLLTLFALSTSVHAEAATASDAQTKAKQYYIVEVVLFKQLNKKGKNKEYWDSDVIVADEFNSSIPAQNNSTTAALAQYNLNNKRFTPLAANVSSLSPQHYKLSDSAAHIKHSRDFRLVAHFGWTQRSLSRQRALPVLITSDGDTERLLPEGELTLYVSRFLHMKVNLSASDCNYSTKAATINPLAEKTIDNRTAALDYEENTNSCTSNTYLFKQNRKMRSKELHYIDNPVFGLLVYVTPFKA